MKASAMTRFILLSILLALAGCQTIGPGNGKSGAVIFESDEVITADFKSGKWTVWYEGDKIRSESSKVYASYPNDVETQQEEIEKELQFIQVNKEFLNSLDRAK